MLTDAAVAALAAFREPFAFFPPVCGFAENRWRFQQATRIEFSAAHIASNEVVWFPRSGVSYLTVEEGAVTVALARELEYSEGSVWPAREQVVRERQHPLAAPVAAGVSRPSTAPGGAKSSVRRARREPMAMVLVAAGSAAAAFVLALVVAENWLRPPQRADSPPISDTRLFTVTAEDEYEDVVRKLGPPESERQLSSADLPQRALVYPARNYAVVLLGSHDGRPDYQQPLRYIGAIRLSDGAVVSSVQLARDSTTDSLLRISARQLLAEK